MLPVLIMVGVCVFFAWWMVRASAREQALGEVARSARLEALRAESLAQLLLANERARTRAVNAYGGANRTYPDDLPDRVDALVDATELHAPGSVALAHAQLRALHDLRWAKPPEPRLDPVREHVRRSFAEFARRGTAFIYFWGKDGFESDAIMLFCEFTHLKWNALDEPGLRDAAAAAIGRELETHGRTTVLIGLHLVAASLLERAGALDDAAAHIDAACTIGESRPELISAGLFEHRWPPATLGVERCVRFARLVVDFQRRATSDPERWGPPTVYSHVGMDDALVWAHLQLAELLETAGQYGEAAATYGYLLDRERAGELRNWRVIVEPAELTEALQRMHSLAAPG